MAKKSVTKRSVQPAPVAAATTTHMSEEKVLAFSTLRDLRTESLELFRLTKSLWQLLAPSTGTERLIDQVCLHLRVLRRTSSAIRKLLASEFQGRDANSILAECECTKWCLLVEDHPSVIHAWLHQFDLVWNELCTLLFPESVSGNQHLLVDPPWEPMIAENWHATKRIARKHLCFCQESLESSVESHKGVGDVLIEVAHFWGLTDQELNMIVADKRIYPSIIVTYNGKEVHRIDQCPLLRPATLTLMEAAIVGVIALSGQPLSQKEVIGQLKRRGLPSSTGRVKPFLSSMQNPKNYLFHDGGYVITRPFSQIDWPKQITALKECYAKIPPKKLAEYRTE